MTEPVDWVPPDIAEALRQTLAEGESNEKVRADLAAKVSGMPGALGELLRTIAAMYADWVDASEMRCVTEAESIRMEQITDSAVACEAWLRSDQ